MLNHSLSALNSTHKTMTASVRFSACVSAGVPGRNQVTNKLEIPAHVGVHRYRALSLELGPPVEADVGQGVDYGFEVNRAFPEVMRIVLQMDFANPFAA